MDFNIKFGKKNTVNIYVQKIYIQVHGKYVYLFRNYSLPNWPQRNLNVQSKPTKTTQLHDKNIYKY